MSDKSKDNVDLPILEYKKINPTKYRARAHGVTGDFPLVFSETFHEGWKTYLVKPNKFQISNSKLQISNKSQNSNIKKEKTEELLSEYKILDGNDEDQATIDELKKYIGEGWVTELGDGSTKKIKHKKWENNKEKLDYEEKYNVDFVSKNYHGTIQNENLPKGSIFETWFPTSYEAEGGKLIKKSGLNKKAVQLPEENHLKVNGYANSWIIDPTEVCKVESDQVDKEKSYCTENEDGSYDMELIVEFWPQRLFYIGSAISLTTLLTCLGYLAYDWRRKSKNKLNDK